jgi:hypothetical protein
MLVCCAFDAPISLFIDFEFGGELKPDAWSDVSLANGTNAG